MPSRRFLPGEVVWRTRKDGRRIAIPAHKAYPWEPLAQEARVRRNREREAPRLFGQHVYEKFTRPTRCRYCNAKVYFIRNNGGSVFLDDLGWPWPKHGCYQISERKDQFARLERMRGGKVKNGRFGLLVATKKKADVEREYWAVRWSDGAVETIEVWSDKFDIEPGDIVGEPPAGVARYVYSHKGRSYRIVGQAPLAALGIAPRGWKASVDPVVSVPVIRGGSTGEKDWVEEVLGKSRRCPYCRNKMMLANMLVHIFWRHCDPKQYELYSEIAMPVLLSGREADTAVALRCKEVLSQTFYEEKRRYKTRHSRHLRERRKAR